METTGIAQGPVQTDYISLFALSRALRLQKAGMRISRGPSALSIAKRRLGVKGNLVTVMKQVDDALAIHPGNPRNQ